MQIQQLFVTESNNARDGTELGVKILSKYSEKMKKQYEKHLFIHDLDSTMVNIFPYLFYFQLYLYVYTFTHTHIFAEPLESKLQTLHFTPQYSSTHFRIRTFSDNHNVMITPKKIENNSLITFNIQSILKLLQSTPNYFFL